MAKDSGGGITSNKNVRPPVRTGQTATGIKPGFVDQLGNMRGNHVTNTGRVSAPLVPMQGKTPAGGGQMLGNQKALDVGAGGPGTGRTIHRTGTQGQHNAAVSSRPAPTGPDPLSPWFPPSAARRSPVVKGGGSSE
jgi:hypothetical protein